MSFDVWLKTECNYETKLPCTFTHTNLRWRKRASDLGVILRVRMWMASPLERDHFSHGLGMFMTPPPGLVDEDVDSDEEGDALTQPSAALQAFFNLFIDLYRSSTISAMTFCIGCFYLGVGGVGGALFTMYGIRPGLPSGHYQRHLDLKFGFAADTMKSYNLEVPGHARHDIDRGTITMPIRCIQEIIEEEAEAGPTMRVRLREMV